MPPIKVMLAWWIYLYCCVLVTEPQSNDNVAAVEAITEAMQFFANMPLGQVHEQLCLKSNEYRRTYGY